MADDSIFEMLGKIAIKNCLEASAQKCPLVQPENLMPKCPNTRV